MFSSKLLTTNYGYTVYVRFYMFNKWLLLRIKLSIQNNSNNYNFRKNETRAENVI